MNPKIGCSSGQGRKFSDTGAEFRRFRRRERLDKTAIAEFVRFRPTRPISTTTMLTVHELFDLLRYHLADRGEAAVEVWSKHASLVGRIDRCILRHPIVGIEPSAPEKKLRLKTYLFEPPAAVHPDRAIAAVSNVDEPHEWTLRELYEAVGGFAWACGDFVIEVEFDRPKATAAGVIDGAECDHEGVFALRSGVIGDWLEAESREVMSAGG
jgi:hypothetical protein